MTTSDSSARYVNEEVEVDHRWQASAPCRAEVSAGRCIVGFEEQTNRQLLLQLRLENRVVLTSTLNPS